jgi:outer membrane protein TolC
VDAREALHRYGDTVVRMRRDAAQTDAKSFEAGAVSYRAVLASRMRHVESLSQHASIAAELLRARARLERAIGSDLERHVSPLARSDQ